MADKDIFIQSQILIRKIKNLGWSAQKFISNYPTVDSIYEESFWEDLKQFLEKYYLLTGLAEELKKLRVEVENDN